jgi:hypothetical protein
MIINPLELSTDVATSEYLENNRIELSRNINALRKKTERDAKGEKCLYCNQKVDSFCNSHTIPYFVLKYIAIDGKVKTFNSIVEVATVKKEKGLQVAGTFRRICKRCDSKIFRDYENEAALTGKITDNMMYEIAMENYLKMIDKRLIEIELYNQTLQWEWISDVNRIDLNEYSLAFEEVKKYILLNRQHKYRILVDETLSYRVPIAFQGSIALIVDLKGNIINDVYCMNEKYKTEEMHICVFPLKNNTRILMFVDRNYKRYDRITRNKIKKLPLNNLLSLINYMIFLYSEEVYLKGDFPEKTLKQLHCVSKISTPIILGIDGLEDLEMKSNELKDMYDLTKKDSIPNLLSEEYKIVP